MPADSVRVLKRGDRPSPSTDRLAGAAPSLTKPWVTIYALLASLGVYGVLASFRIALTYFDIDSDTSHTLMLWYGIRDHGLGWLVSFVFTQDNWLLSLAPIDFLGFAIFGPHAKIAMIVGWLIFLANAALTGLIARQLGAKRVAPFVVVALLNVGLYAHLFGFVSYSTSHNVTHLFGLASILVLAYWIERPRTASLGLVLGLLLVGTISDPWMLAAYVVPIVIASVAAASWPRGPVPRRAALELAVVGLVVIIATKTKLFGAMAFLPSVAFVPASHTVIDANSVYLVRDLGGLLDLLPGGDDADFLPGLISLACIVGYVLWRCTTVNAVRVGRSSRMLVIATIVLSIAGTVSAFVVSASSADIHSGRYLINAGYLLILLVALLTEHAWQDRSRWGLGIGGALFVSFLCAGVTSTSAVVSGTQAPPKQTLVEDVLDLLRRHRLTYGYGAYWGAQANAVTGASGDRIRVRPVAFDPRDGRMLVDRWESSRQWFTDEDIPAGTDRFFVIVKRDHENCAVVSLCVDGLTRQFGEPAETYQEGATTLMVWHHQLVGTDPTPLPVVRGRAYPFTDAAPIRNGRGWSTSEDWGTWSNGAQSDLRFRFDRFDPSRDVRMTIDARCFWWGQGGSGPIGVVVDGQQLGTLPCTATENAGRRDFIVPATLVTQGKGVIDVRFEIASPRSPRSLGLSPDERRLGVGLSAIGFD